MRHSAILTSEKTLQWHETETVRRILNEIAGDADNRPSHVRMVKRYPMTREEWLEYDREDVRVIALEAAHAAFFDAVSLLRPDVLATVGLCVSIDAAIDQAIAKADEKIAQEARYVELLLEGVCIGEAREIASVVAS